MAVELGVVGALLDEIAAVLLCVAWLLDDGVTSFELEDPGSPVPVHAVIIADASAKGTILRIIPSSFIWPNLVLLNDAPCVM